ncbi:MAG: peptidylprolyl isomerase [Gemmatimonadaceae bacterium]|nr:peptidylprolyl isomerase [Gemmatimonadaceae bacterium]
MKPDIWGTVFTDKGKERMLKRLVVSILLTAAPICMSAQTVAPTLPAAAASRPQSAKIPVDRVVAVVGDQVILWSDVMSSVNQQRAAGMQLPPDSAGQAAVARDVLNQLVDEEILVRKAHELKIEVTPDEVNRSVEEQVKRVRQGFQTEDEFKNELRTAGFGTPEEYRRTLYEQYYRRALQQRAFEDLRKTAVSRNVSDAEIDEAFQKNKEALQKQPATVTFRQVVVAPKPTADSKKRARAKADSVLAEIRKGGDFEQIAKRESMDPASKQTGGDLGWTRRGAMVPEFERVMFALNPGQISPVVETAFGFHIIRVDRVQAAEVKAHHILISPVVDSADVAAARREADSVGVQLRRGAAFDSLVAKHHDPAEEKGILQPFLRDSLPASYAAATAGKKAGDVTDAFELSSPRGGSKFAVVQMVTVNEAGQYVETEVRERIRQQLVAERATRSLLDDLRKQTYVSLRL